jgi:SAM-dependent methyltransferase
MNDPTFDRFASQYNDALQTGLSVSGETSDFFAESRLRYLSNRIQENHFTVRRALDFGCGIGSTTRGFFSHFELDYFAGVDPSSESINIAKKSRQKVDASNDCEVEYFYLKDFLPREQFDLVYCNGVFHHIGLDDRGEAMTIIYESLKSGGVFAFWENNPYSLPARYVMSRIPFDQDALMVWPSHAREMIRGVGFKPILTEYRFIFPRFIRWMRWSENLVCKLPIGAQYLVLAVK